MISYGRFGSFEVDLISEAQDIHSKGCLMANLDGDLASELISFSKNKIQDKNLTSNGRETEPHLTVLYGFNPDFETNPLESFLENQETITGTLGSISRFEKDDCDVLKAEIISDSTQQLHYNIKNNFKNDINSTYTTYSPHVTLAYIKKGTHRELDGDNSFAGKKFSVKHLIYSTPDKVRKKFKLKG